MKIRADQLQAHLDESILPLYFVTGDEPLLVTEALDAIRTRAREEGYTEREVFTADRGFDWNRILAGSASLSLFADKRVLELRLPTGKPGDVGSRTLVELCSRLSDDTLVVVSAPRLERGQSSSKWVKALDKAGAMVQVWPVDARALPGWIAARMRRLGLEPSRDAVRLLADRVEGNLLAAAQELEKLRLVIGTGPVDAEQVEAAVADSARFNIFKLADAAVAGRADRALRILGALRAEGAEPVLVLWALTRELRAIALIRDDLEAGRPLSHSLKQRGVWSSREDIVRACAGRHSPSSLHRLVRRAELADQVVKGRRPGQPWQELLALTVGLARGPRVRRAA
ncbi:MAG: DNA polymerase III subunit delta [Gammaproteobacteria bacterium]